jgi:hypothetical protein
LPGELLGEEHAIEHVSGILFDQDFVFFCGQIHHPERVILQGANEQGVSVSSGSQIESLPEFDTPNGFP